MTRGRLLMAGIGLALAGGYVLAHEALFQALTPPLLPPMAPAEGVGSLSAETCGGCHDTLAAEWRESAHGKATTDPLYIADLANQDAPYFCDHCHAPLVEQRETIAHGLWSAWPELTPRLEANDRHLPGLRHEGVTCVACHQRDGAMVGPFATTHAPHPVIVDTTLSSEESCRPCHSLDLRAVGDLERPLMDTFGEWRAYREAGGEHTCVDCHMPRVADRPVIRGGPPRPARDHTLRGPGDKEFVKEGAQVEDMLLRVDDQGDLRGSLTLINGTGHHMPTAEPHRKLTITLEALGPDGVPLAETLYTVERAIDLHTMTEYHDTSLRPRERRPIDLRVSTPAGATRARFIVRFVLWDPSDSLAHDAGLDEDDLVHTLYTQTLTLTPSEP